MKKLHFLVAAMAMLLGSLSIETVTAQSAPSSKLEFHYGITLGGQFATPHIPAMDGGGSVKGGSGFAGGLICEWQLPRCGFAFGAALQYERRPIRFEGAPMPPYESSVHILGKDFLAIPIQLKYKFPIKAFHELVSPFVLTGPDFAFRLDHAQGPKVHYGWNFGAGLDIVNFVQIYGGYRLGFNDLREPVGIRDNGGFVAVAVLFAL